MVMLVLVVGCFGTTAGTLLLEIGDKVPKGTSLVVVMD